MEKATASEPWHRATQALAHYDMAVRSNPNDAAAWRGRAAALIALNRPEEAVESCKRALAIKADDDGTLTQLGNAQLRLGRAHEALASFDRALSIKPRNVEALCNRGWSLVGLGRPQDAVASLNRALRFAPGNPIVLAQQGNVLQAAGQLAKAVTSYDQALAIMPGEPNVLRNKGSALLALERFEAALACYDEVLRSSADDPWIFNNRGLALLALQRPESALECFQKAVSLERSDADLWYNHGNALMALARKQEALSSFDEALRVNPDHVPALINRGKLRLELNQHQEVLADLERVLELMPDHVDALSNRGLVLATLNRLDEALTSHDKAMALDPGAASVWFNRGNCLRELKRPEEALASYDRAIAIRRDYPEAHDGRGIALSQLNRFEDALQSLDTAIALKPDHVDAYYNRGTVLKTLVRLDEALAAFERALVLNREHYDALALYWSTARNMCDWSVADRAEVELINACRLPNFVCSNFFISSIDDDPSVPCITAESFVRNNTTVASGPLHPNGGGKSGKLRIGYLSADFRQHPIAVLIAELVELHDRSQFEVFGFSAGRNDQSPIRQRLEAAFDAFVDVQRMTDAELRQAIQEAQIDIIVDLGGLTRDGRMLALAQRAAPVQVTYLGYPATVGAQFIDYAIVDNYVVPEGDAEFFTEKLAYLPHCYLVSDRKRPIAQRNPSRAEFGLPDEGLVFCCFSSPHKINARIFDIWMHILTAIPDSVLWLVEDNKWVSKNLRKEAETRGVDPARLVFTPYLSFADHLAALRLADLFLDTWPYNAHTTANDALWVGLPVLTHSGRYFAARVAGSLLHAIGMPELVAHSLEDYEALALALARDPVRLTALREQLIRNRLTEPLFDTDRFRRHLEAAYRQMWSLHNNAEGPRSFHVPA